MNKKDEIKTEETKETVKSAPKKTARKFTDDTVVTVISNVDGKLYFRSRKNDEALWAEYGDEVDMTVRELKTMKAEQPRFFQDNWVIFAEKDLDVIKHLKLEKYYKDILFPEDLEALFTKTPEEFGEILHNAVPNVKSLILGKARELYKTGELSNVHIIRIIEDKLGVNIDVDNPR
jgi:hypothetical protein